MGRKKEAATALARLRELAPDAETRVPQALRNLGLQEPDLHSMFEALEIAGLDLTDIAAQATPYKVKL